MSPVEFKKRPCRPVKFKGQGPLINTMCEGGDQCWWGGGGGGGSCIGGGERPIGVAGDQ